MIRIIRMTEELYNTIYAKEIEEGSLWDYPVDELDHLLDDEENKVYALINGRLFETDFEF